MIRDNTDDKEDDEYYITHYKDLSTLEALTLISTGIQIIITLFLPRNLILCKTF